MYSAFSWFISVFVVGILINVISAYAMPHIEKYVGRFSDYQRINSEKRKAEIDREVNMMLEDHDYFLYRLSKKGSNQVIGFIISIFLILVLFIPTTVMESYDFIDLVAGEIDKLDYGKRVFQLIFYSMHPIRFSMLLTWLLWNFVLFFIMFYAFTGILIVRKDVTILREYFKRKPEINHPVNIE